MPRRYMSPCKPSVPMAFCKSSSQTPGTGYPPAVLHALVHGEGENTPHILGLHIVEQIMEAHGGEVRFTQNVPNGAKTILTLPLT